MADQNSDFVKCLKFLVISWNDWFHSLTVTYTCLYTAFILYIISSMKNQQRDTQTQWWLRLRLASMHTGKNVKPFLRSIKNFHVADILPSTEQISSLSLPNTCAIRHVALWNIVWEIAQSCCWSWRRHCCCRSNTAGALSMSRGVASLVVNWF